MYRDADNLVKRSTSRIILIAGNRNRIRISLCIGLINMTTDSSFGSRGSAIGQSCRQTYGFWQNTVHCIQADLFNLTTGTNLLHGVRYSHLYRRVHFDGTRKHLSFTRRVSLVGNRSHGIFKGSRLGGCSRDLLVVGTESHTLWQITCQRKCSIFNVEFDVRDGLVGTFVLAQLTRTSRKSQHHLWIHMDGRSS